MNVLISGCSFTQWPEYPGGPNICWPTYLQELAPQHQYTNLAEAAAGNQYICDSIIRATLTEQFDMVLVMWSGVSRLDYLTSLEDPDWEKLFDSYGFYRRLPCNKLGWIFSGGRMGTWFKNPVAHKMFYEMYKVSNNLSLGAINLQEIVKLQQYLKSKNIPYRFMSYVNYWGHGDHLSPNGDFGVADHDGLKIYTDAIDWSSWIFTDKQNGLYEMAAAANDFQEDKFHPGDRTQETWAKFVLKNL